MPQIVHGEATKVPAAEPLVPWWSFTKTALAGAALTLVAQGRLDLDAPMAGAPYSLRHVLQHRSGLRDYGASRAYHDAVAAGAAPWPRAELLEQAQADRLLFAPGAAFSYSNIGYLFVRETIEAASGRALDDALRELLFAPLGIDGVFVASSPEDWQRTLWGSARSYHPGWVYHGLLVGSPASAASLLHRLLHGPLLPPALKEQMLDPIPVGGPLPGRPFLRPAYGLGLMIDTEKPLGRVVGHSGAGPGSVSAVYSFLDLGEARTLSSFLDRDDGAAAGDLETQLWMRARARPT